MSKATSRNWLPDAAQSKLLRAYIALLLKWNATHNLTGWSDAEDIFLQLAASLSVYAPLLPKTTVGSHRPLVLDLGTGGGIPGIPLAIIRPDCHMLLLDSKAKKTAFVKQAASLLGLKNIQVHTGRAEQYPDRTKAFDCIVSRAFGSIENILDLTQRLIAPEGCWLLERGDITARQLDGCKGRCKDVTCYPLPSPAKGQIISLHRCS